MNVSVGKVISMRCGASSLQLHSDGTIILSGLNVKVQGSQHVDILGEFVDVN